MEERQASRQHKIILTNRGTCALNGISDILSFDVNGNVDDPGHGPSCKPVDAGER